MTTAMPKPVSDHTLHGFDLRRDALLNRIRGLPSNGPRSRPFLIAPSNRDVLLQFSEDIAVLPLKGKGRPRSLAQQTKLLVNLAVLAELMGEKCFDSLSMEDMEDLKATVYRRTHWSSSYQVQLLKGLKVLLRIRNKGVYPANVNALEVGAFSHRKIQHEELVTEAELLSMIEVAANARDRAVLAGLALGLRVSELGTIKFGSVRLDGNLVILSVNGKTGQRDVPTIKWAPYIRRWLEEHPTKKEEDWLWLSHSNNMWGHRLGYNSIRALIKKYADTAKVPIRRRRNPHNFRHSAITEFMRAGGKVREASRLFGLSPEEIHRTYDHVCQDDVISELERQAGVTVAPIQVVNVKPKTCGACALVNEPHRTDCDRCGSPLSDLDAFHRVDRMKELEDRFAKMEKAYDMLIQSVVKKDI